MRATGVDVWGKGALFVVDQLTGEMMTDERPAAPMRIRVRTGTEMERMSRLILSMARRCLQHTTRRGALMRKNPISTEEESLEKRGWRRVRATRAAVLIYYSSPRRHLSRAGCFECYLPMCPSSGVGRTRGQREAGVAPALPPGATWLRLGRNGSDSQPAAASSLYGGWRATLAIPMPNNR